MVTHFTGAKIKSKLYTLIKFPVLIDFEINQISCKFEIIDSKDSFIPE